MSSTNYDPLHPVRVQKGLVMGGRAAAHGIWVTDDQGNEVFPAAELRITGGGTVSEPEDNVAQINVGGGGADSGTPGSGIIQMLNNSGDDLALYDVVVVDETADNAVTTTTTAQDTRIVGVVQAPIADGEIGPVLFNGWTPGVRTEAAVTRGDYLETSTTAGAATTNPTRREGSFGVLTTDGDPAASTSSDWRVWRVSWAGGALGGTPAGWATLGFDDSTWAAPSDLGPYLIAAHAIAPAEAVDDTTVSGLVWLARPREFELTALPTTPVLQLTHDDAVEVYLNGVLVHSSGVLANDTVSLSPSDFVIGTNVLAIKITNATGSNDFAINATYVGVLIVDDSETIIGTGGVFVDVTGIPSALLYGDDLAASGGAGTGTPGWFIVTDPAYGAVGDGTTDDTAAINLAIAALISAGKGVLYFPARTYKTTAALTAISVPALILGDGHGSWDGTTSTGSKITCDSATAALFTISSDAVTMEHLALVNVAAGTPSAGGGVVVTSGYGFQMLSCSIRGFWIDVDYQVGSIYRFAGCYFISPVKYGLKLQNTSVGDEGDGMVSDCWFYSDGYAADAAIRIESGGGIKIVNSYINRLLGSTNYFARGIDVANATVTSQLRITATMIENITEDGIHIVSNGANTWDLIEIIACGIDLYRASATNRRAVSISTDTLGNINTVSIVQNTFRNNSANLSSAAISLTKVNNAIISGNLLDQTGTGWSAYLVTSGCTNVYDQNGGVAAGVSITGTPSSGDVPIASSATQAAWGAAGGGVTGFATPAVVLGTAAAAGAATTVIRSDSTIVAFDATVPVTQALGDAAATGSVAKAARRDHTHGMPALSSATPLVASGSGAVGTALPSSRQDHVHPAQSTSSAHILLADGHSTPFTFNDLLQMDDGSDFMWSDS